MRNAKTNWHKTRQIPIGSEEHKVFRRLRNGKNKDPKPGKR